MSHTPPWRGVAAATIGLCAASGALAQSSAPAVFVGNNGNLDGTVTTFRVNPDVSLSLVDEYDANTNPYAIDLSPNGRYLAVTRASAEEVNEELRIFEVNGDASLTQIVLTLVPNSPLDVEWLTNGLLAVLQTNLGTGQYAVRTYAFDGESLDFASAMGTGGFTSSVESFEGLPFVYTGRTLGGNQIRVFAYGQDGSLSLVQQVTTAAYPIDLTFSADGKTLYAAGGISSGGDKISAYSVNQETGFLTPVAGSPFTSPGSSPAYLAVSPDNALLFAGHGSDATIHSFFISEKDGSLTPTGFSFDVGQQGTLGDIATAPGLLFATDNSTISDGLQGVYLFEVDPVDGSFEWEGPVYSTQGVAPDAVVAWAPPAAGCPGDADGDGDVDSEDLNSVLASFGDSVPAGESGDVTGDGQVNSEDLNAVLAAFGSAC